MRVSVVAILMIFFAVIMAGCVNDNGGSTVGNNVSCDPPLRVIGGHCCLDQDNDGVCDTNISNPVSTPVANESPISNGSAPNVTQPVENHTGNQTINGTGPGNNTHQPNGTVPSVANNTGNESNASINGTIGNTTNGTSAQETPAFSVRCHLPYITDNDGCCLDANEDGACDEIEDAAPCGDGVCTEDEMDSCCTDCGCPENQTCIDDECISTINISVTAINLFKTPKIPPSFCGDGICGSGETTDNCCTDCGCPTGMFCSSDGCKVFTIPNQIHGFIPLGPTNTTNDTGTPWIVVTIDEIQMHTSGDGSGPGELMFYSQTKSGNVTQLVKWPVGGYKAIWKDSVLLAGKREAVPLFALPEASMGDSLDIHMLFGESDLPSVLPFIGCDLTIPQVKSLFHLSDCNKDSDDPIWVVLLSNTIFKPFLALVDAIGGNHCHTNDFLGELHTTVTSPSWSIGQQHVDMNDLSVNYTIRRVYVHPDDKLTLKLKGVKIIDDADSGNNPGEILGWGRFASALTASSFGTGMYEDYQKIFDLGQRQVEGPANLNVDLSGDSYTAVGKPFLYAELDLFDRDSRCSQPNGMKYTCYYSPKVEEVGITSLLLFQNDSSGEFTIDSGGVGSAETTWELSK
ncbi:MAG: hypothetical protein J7L23_00835 [Candidatus Diapherotrites archaeon]|nr:hypothetical protein [Candidatus Diapherotrites archaeon]